MRIVYVLKVTFVDILTLVTRVVVVQLQLHLFFIFYRAYEQLVIYQVYTSTNKRKKTRPEKRPSLYTIWCLFSGSRVFTESSSNRRGEALQIINHLSQAGPLLPLTPMLCSLKSHNLKEYKLFFFLFFPDLNMS